MLALHANADARPRVLAFAADNWLAMSVGKFEPGHGWAQSTDFYIAPPPGEVFTIFGTSGRLGEVTTPERRRPSPGQQPAGWSAGINRGVTGSQPYALAVEGSWPEANEKSTELSLDDAAGLLIAAGFLKNHGLKVEHPLLTQAYQVDLLGDGQSETLLCAHSDLTALADEREDNIYAVALLHFMRDGQEKTVPLAAQTSWKPARRTIDEHEHYYGKRDFDRLLSFHDIDGDGRREIALYRSRDGATQIDIFTFDGQRVKKVLSAYKPNYN